MLNKKIKAFTLAELMITLALTSVMVSFSYMGLNYTQKLLYQYNGQSHFITQINELTKRINISFAESNQIEKQGDDKLIFKTDSNETQVQFNPIYILTFKNNKTDTFKLENKSLKIEREELGTETTIELIKKIEFDVYFQKQKFHLTFSKNYDAYSKLMIETADEHN